MSAKTLGNLLIDGIRAAWRWWINRSVAIRLVRGGIGLIGLSVLGGFGFNLSWADLDRLVTLELQTGDTPLILSVAANGVGILLVIVGLIWHQSDRKREIARHNRSRLIVIEQLSLKQAHTISLGDSLPSNFSGQVEKIFHDIRDLFDDNVIRNPEKALEEVSSVKKEVNRRISDHDRADVQIIYGGRMSVPFTFLTGVLLGDEGQITVFDWDRRNTGGWRELSAADDGERFRISGIDQTLGTEVVLAISVSYPVLPENIAASFPGLPVVTMQMESLSSDAHWSARKQAELSMQFLQTLKQVMAQGVTRIHILLAAPNSVSFEFGRRFDEALLPQSVVYHFRNGGTPPFPWGVQIPKYHERPTIVVNQAQDNPASP